MGIPIMDDPLLNSALAHLEIRIFVYFFKCFTYPFIDCECSVYRHMVSHRDKAVSCEQCGLEFPDGRALINHRHSHNKEPSARQFSCAECGKTFGSRSSQQIHARIHTGERPYGCRFCWKAFADGGTLRKHERIHTGEKPYACAVCPRAFNQRVSNIPWFHYSAFLAVKRQDYVIHPNFITSNFDT